MTIRLNNANRNSGLDAIDTLINTGGAGTIEIFEGNVNGTFGSDPAGTLITTITFGATAFETAGTTLDGEINSETLANGGDGTASPSALVAGCFVISNGAGTHVLDGNITTTAVGTGDLLLTDINIGNGVVISIPTVKLTAGNSPA